MPLRNRLLAFLALAGLFCGASGVLPALTVFFGQLDDDHQVVVAFGDGALEVRIHHHNDREHAENAAGPDSGSHTAASQWQDDHVLQFVSATDSVAQIWQASAADHVAILLAPIAAEQSLPRAHPETEVSHARPPPGEATLSRCLRSVVLLV